MVTDRRTTAVARRPGVTPRLLLLALVVCGIAGMHTLGHARHDAGMTAHSVMTTVERAVAPGHPDTGWIAVAEPELTAPHPSAGEHPVMPGDTAAMCLAVLAAVGLVVLVAVRAALSRRRVRVRRRGSPLTTVSRRGPPRWRPTGLAINAVAVLRI